MARYKLSTGEYINKSTIDSRIRIAKEKALYIQFDKYGYNFCVTCGRSAGVMLDCSHEIPVDVCQKNGKSELCYSLENIKIRCRDCHNKHDGLYLSCH